jgi:DNA-binding beta-propeller fold protein YncE
MHATSVTRHTRALLLGLLAVVGTACASTAPKREIVWPFPPEKPRVKHLRAFRVPADFDRPWWRKVADAIVPANPRAGLRNPNAMAFSPEEKTLYVANPLGNALVAVELETGKMRTVGESGPAPVLRPFGVGVSASGDVFVADASRGEVLVFGPAGNFLRRFGAGKLEWPLGLAVDRERQVVYVLSGTSSQKTDHRVEVFSLKGDHLRTLGGRGEGNGQFNFPAHLAVAPDGRLFVSDMLNFRVQVFDPEGQFLSSFGQIGAGGPGYFDKAKGIAFDAFGNVYVADALHGIQIFNPRFQPLMSFAEKFLQMPTGVAIDSRNHIFVSDPPSALVHEFVLVNTTATDSYPGADPASPPVGGPARGEISR